MAGMVGGRYDQTDQTKPTRSLKVEWRQQRVQWVEGAYPPLITAAAAAAGPRTTKVSPPHLFYTL